MASLFTKTKLYIEANSKTWDDTKVSLENNGSGDYIKIWTYSFDTEEIDTDGAFSTPSFTVPSGAAGKYFAFGQV